MKKVKLTFPPEKWDFAKHSPSGKCIWDEYEFFLNQDIKECDFWLVCGNLNQEKESTIVSPENVIFDTSESADIVNYTKSFLSQFSYVSSFRSDLPHPQLIKSIPIIPWFVKKSFDELQTLNDLTKTKKMSLLASNKKISINHIKRLNFVKKVHKYFGNEIDIYGAGFTDHIYDKAPTLEPYMFSIILETITDREYFSEKIGDSLLSLTFPIYYGCSNLDDYMPSESFKAIDINNFSQSVDTIKSVLNDNNFYKNHFESILEAKDRYLNKFSIFPVMADILDKVSVKNKDVDITRKQKITIDKFKMEKDLNYVIKRFETLAYDAITRIF